MVLAVLYFNCQVLLLAEGAQRQHPTYDPICPLLHSFWSRYFLVLQEKFHPCINPTGMEVSIYSYANYYYFFMAVICLAIIM